jgi:hypothetical protein
VVPPLAEARLRDCEGVASTLRLQGARPYDLRPDPAYAEALATTMRVLQRARTAGLEQLRQADRPAEQGDAAAAVARAYQAAGLSLADARPAPLVAAPARAVVAALRRTGGAYADLAVAAHDANRTHYARAARRVRAAEADIEGSLAALRAYGYGIS